MAAFTENAMKLAGIAATLPFVAVAAGFRMRFVQAKETSSSGVRRVYRVCDLPAYSTADRGDLKCDGDIFPRNSLEAGISAVRKTMQGLLGNFAHAADNSIKTTAKTSVTTTVATYKYVRENTEDVTRAAIVAGAGLGGFFFRHNGNPWRRLSYGFLVAMPCAVVCYPSQLTQLCQSGRDLVRGVWQRNLWKHVEHKYYKGEPRPVSQAPALYTCENFDAISLSDFDEPDVENVRTVGPCIGNNVEEFNMDLDLCRGDSVEKPSIAELCPAESSEKVSTTGIGNAENVEQPDKSDCRCAENFDKPAENVENVGELDKMYCSHEENIDKPSSVDVCYCNAENVGELRTVNFGAKSKEKLWIVENCNLEEMEKNAKGGRTDQSNPEDKDMYSTRSS